MKNLKTSLILLGVLPIANIQAAENDTDWLDEVVVTGELQARNLQETTTSVSVFNQAQLDESSEHNVIKSAVKRSANVNTIFGGKGINIRGISDGGIAGSGSGRTIDVSIDGLSLPSSQSAFFGPYSSWDIEQIEILRGPQSTQQGRNALAGSVQIRSADPVFESEAKARIRMGQMGDRNVALMLNQPLNKRWAARVALESNHHDGWVKNPTREDDKYDERTMKSARFKLLYEPNENVSAIFNHSYTQNNAGEDFVITDRLPDRVNISDNEAAEGSRHRITGLRIDAELNNYWSLLSETNFYSHDYKRIEDIDNTPNPLAFIDRVVFDKAISQDVKFIFDNEQRLRGAFGLFATTIDRKRKGTLESDANMVDTRVPLNTARFGRSLNSKREVNNIAIYGEMDFDFAKNWTLIAGGRYDYEKQKTKDDTSFYLTPAIAPLPPNESIVTKPSFSAFLPKLGIRKQFNDDISSSFIIQRGYRAGGSQRNPFNLEIVDFDPEYTWNYELGLRTQFMNDKLVLNGNLFYTDWQDQQVSVKGPSGNRVDVYTDNAGSSSIYGAEVELRYAPSNKLSMYSSLGYAKTKFDEFISGGNDLSGNEFAAAPKVTLSIGGKYNFSNRWFMQLDGNYSDSYFSEATNQPENKVKSRFILDSRVGYNAKNWSASLYARNLTDKDYVTQAAGKQVRTGEPRVVGLEFNTEF